MKTQDEIKAEIAAFIAAKIAEFETAIEQTPLPPFWANEGTTAHAEHVLWVYRHLRLLDWGDVHNVFEEFLELDQHHFDETTWLATIVRYKPKDIRDAFAQNDMGQLHAALKQLGGEKAAAYEIKLKREPRQTHPPARDHKMETAVQDVGLIRDLWKRHYPRSNRKEGDCLRPERLAAEYHDVDYDDLLTQLKNKWRSGIFPRELG